MKKTSGHEVSNSKLYNTNSTLKAHRVLWKRGQKDWKSQRTRMSGGMQCLIYLTGSYSLDILTILLPNQDMHTDSTCNCGWETSQKASHPN